MARAQGENTTTPESSPKFSDVTLASKDDSVKPLLSCDQFKHTTKTDNGMIKHKKNKHDIDQHDGNISNCKEQKETPSFTCTFCNEAFESESIHY